MLVGTKLQRYYPNLGVVSGFHRNISARRHAGKMANYSDLEYP